MLLWKRHVDWLMFKLGSACFSIRAVRPYMLQETTRIIYWQNFHSEINYAIIFWRNTPHSIHIFRLKKRVIWIILLTLEADSLAGNFLRNWKMFPTNLSTYFLSYCSWLNREQFKSYSQIHSINRRHKNNFHYAVCNLTIFKRTYYFGNRVFNNLLSHIKN
jgi:hypothetical protein